MIQKLKPTWLPIGLYGDAAGCKPYPKGMQIIESKSFWNWDIGLDIFMQVYMSNFDYQL